MLAARPDPWHRRRVRRSAILGVVVVLAASGCARRNPAFSGGDTDENPMQGSTSLDASTAGPATGESVSAGTESAGASSDTEDPAPSTSGTGATSETGMTDDPLLCVEVFAACDAYGEDTCPEGQRCRPWSDGTSSGVACVAQLPAATPLALGDTCVHRCDEGYGVDDCPARSICDPHTDPPTCVPLCGPMGTCDVGFCEDEDAYGLCRDTDCDPLAQNCQPGQGCYFDGNCHPAGDSGLGGDCGFINDCQAGLVCVVNTVADCLAAGQSCCAQICDPKDDTCGNGQSCIDTGEGVGVCATP